MRAVRYHEHGGPGVLQVDEVERPEPGPGELLVAVRAASVNPLDALYREGVLGGEDGAFEGSFLPAVTGTDFAGEVVAVGDGVREFREGDRVFGTGLADSPDATVAEYAVVPADHAAGLPTGVDFEVGAGVAHVGGTAWRALVEFCDLAPGDACLIHGASGGVGHVAVQIAAATGARVVGTAGSERARTRVRELGADAVLDYDRADLEGAVREAAGGGVDVVLDPHKGSYLDLDIAVANTGGRIATIAGAFPEIEHPAPFQTKELRLFGVAMHNTPDIGAAMERLARLLEAGDLTAAVDRTYGLAEAGEAQRVQAEDHVVGKVVITV